MKTLFQFLAIGLLLASCQEDVIQEVSTPEMDIPKPAFYYDGVYEIRDGKEVDLTQEQYAITKSTQEFYEISSINPNYTYIGSVLQANSIDIGQYRPVAYPSVLKPEVTISFSLPIRSKTIAPTRSSFNNAIVEAIGDKDFSGKQSQVFSYKMKEFDYYKEVNMAFGANVNIGQLFSIDTSISSDRKQHNTALFIDFSQVYFNVGMDIPYDGNIFINETEREHFANQQPVYINSVNMGRKAVLIVESEESYSNISVAIRTAFNIGLVSGELTLDAETEEMLKKAQIYIYIIGGDGEEAAKVVNGFGAFQEFIIKGGVYSKEVYGVPISFSAAYASDNSMFISQVNI